MELLSSAFSWFSKRRMHQIEYFMSHPIEVQENLFKDLVSSAKNTEYGKRYNFSSVNNISTFNNYVPVSTYEDLSDDIERMMKGEQNILWPTKINQFSKSSGTTNARSKFIPVSKEALEDCHYKAGKDLMTLYINNYPNTKMMFGKSLGIGGSYQKSNYNENTISGDVSAIIMKNLPFWAEFMRAPEIEVALMDEWESKIEKIAETTIDKNITSIAGVPTWTLVLIERILEKTGKKTLHEVWPNLEVFFHGAVAFGPYRKTFKNLIGNPEMNFMDVYNASEGFFGIQDTTNDDEMLLLLDYGVFYEFIPMDEFGKEQPKVVQLADVEIGKNYAIVISTNAGLWRYLIGDTVRFTSKFPYRIKISGRTKHFINAFGEEVVIENAEEAIKAACLQTGAEVRNFTAAPVYLESGKKGGHEWAIEFKIQPNDSSVFIQVLDDTLRSVNSDYDAKRYKDIALVAPKVHFLEQKSFYNWMKGRGKLGGQNKVPRLANHREYIDSLLSSLK
ncbi:MULTISPECIES: GH3 auxin-responsive promoter family protein [Flammeovirga]|uniref:GH3 auxin-responsive promoter family protein n=1 Tax=Flammeovirga agarivorans TaxID=2726742 RepID=A0A7X8SLN4_9BACT|nr:MULTISPECIES: GH3 auxin-responsive promoter family protein [Flammeovirga]NLR92423.1 GH3 auxin-responsive promoter family protein [Flammeovirga agarivorans]